jgi:hypothetical protein
MLLKVAGWLQIWPAGKVAATRQYLNHQGGVDDIPTQRAVTIAWHPREFEYLVKIIREVKPDWDFGIALERFGQRGVLGGRLVTKGQRLCEMVAYLVDVKDLFETLKAVREGRIVGRELDQTIATGDFWSNT